MAVLDPGGRDCETSPSSSSPSTTTSITSSPSVAPRPTRRERRSSQRNLRLFEPTRLTPAPLLATERQTLRQPTLSPTDHDVLCVAVTHRTRTIYQQAINERPEWLVELLTELDDRGTLEQVRLGQVHQLVLDRAVDHDLGTGEPLRNVKRSIERVSVRTV